MQKLRGSVSRWMTGAATIAAALVLAACGGGGDSTATAGEGTLRVALTDAPSCYEHVFVTVEKVRVHTSSSAGDNDAGWQDLALAAPKRIDLLNLTNGVLEELGSTALPAGNYSQLRLVLADNTGQQPLANAVQPIGGSLTALKTPSAQQSGLKLQVHFTVEANKQIDLVLDFDACKSVVPNGRTGDFSLKPVISVTPRFVTSVQGFVTTTMTLSATSVSAQQNGEIVRSTMPDASGKFVLSFLPDGTYTLVITSDGRATGVISGVPVSTASAVTTVNGTATAIVLPTSTMSTVSGTVTASASTGATTTTAAVGDATVTALQTVGGGTIQVASTPVDLDLGSYTLRLPSAAPVRAPFTTGSLSFAPETAAAGKYTLQAAAPGRSPLSRAIDVSSGAAATANFAY